MRTRANQRGAITLEFVLCLPVLLLLIFMSFDLTRFVIMQGKSDRLAYEIGGLVSQRATFRTDSSGDVIPFSQQELEDIGNWIAGRLELPIKLRVTQLNNSLVQWETGQGNCEFSSKALYSGHNIANQRLFVVDFCHTDNEFSLVNGWFNDNQLANYASRTLMVER